MIRRLLAPAAVLVAMGSTAEAQGRSPADAAPAESLFDEAKQLEVEGRIALACTRFAQSQKLAMGIGVTLHLADCFERLGRTASAWTEFRMGENLARERGDKREEVARAHAQALEPKLNRLTLAVAPSLRGRLEMRLDGEVLPLQAWNIAWPVDPGDHVVTASDVGRAPRVFTLHVEAGAAPVVLAIEDPYANAVPASTVPVAPAPGVTPTPVDLPPPAPAPSADAGATRRWASLGLVIAGVVGLGVGAGCLVAKNQSMSNGSPAGSPHQDDGAAMWSAVGFVGGGAALVSALVLYLTAPASKDAAWRAAPAPLMGGAGVFVRTQF